jgi:hypothetical protein
VGESGRSECVRVMFGWQESERKGEKINWGLNSFYFIFSGKVDLDFYFIFCFNLMWFLFIY